MSTPKSKVYYCFIFFLQKDCHIHNYCFFYRGRCSKSIVSKNRNPEYTANRRLRCTHSEVHSSKCRLGKSEASKIGGNSRSFNNTEGSLALSAGYLFIASFCIFLQFKPTGISTTRHLDSSELHVKLLPLAMIQR